MSKLEEAKNILNELKVPPKQQSDLCGYVILAMTDIKKNNEWANATNKWIRIHDVIAFIRKFYEVSYAENSRETFRKQVMHHFRNATFIEDNGKAINSPNYRYRLTDEMLLLVKTFQSSLWEEQKNNFLKSHQNLIDLYSSKKAVRKMPVKINGDEFTFSPGKHNQLQKFIIEEFAPRFAENSECLYVGDTIQKGFGKE